MNSEKLVPLGLALGICYAVYKFAPNATAKTAAVAVAGVIVARQLPYVGPALA